MRRITGLVLLAVAAGCGGEEVEGGAAERRDTNETAYEKQFQTADTSEAYESNRAPAPVAPVQGGGAPGNSPGVGPLTATGNLVGPGQESPVGSVVVRQTSPNATQIRIQLTRGAGGTQLQAQVVSGGCGATTGTPTPVGQPFSGGQSGIATLIAEVQRPTASLLDGRHAVRVVAGEGTTGQVLACAELPALQG